MLPRFRSAAPLLAAIAFVTACEAKPRNRPTNLRNGVAVDVTPKIASVSPAGTVPFTAAVSGAADTAVTWSVVEAAGGTIDGSGLYTAPTALGAYSVVATSVSDPTKSGAATARVVVPSSTDPNGLVPLDRVTTWNPGLNSAGGIPVRTTPFRTINPSGGDDTATIQSALDNCPPNQVVVLGAGNFTVSGDGLEIRKSNVVLRGAGPTQTIITKTGAGMPVIIIGQRWFKYTVARPLTANAVKGSFVATVSDASGLKVGELVHINQLSDDAVRNDATPPVRKVWWGPNTTDPNEGVRRWFCEQNRPIGQAMEIKSIAGNTLTFTTPFHIDIETALSAHLRRITGQGTGLDAAWTEQEDVVRWSGIEDLAVVNGDGGDGGGNIHLFATMYSWVKNVESRGSIGHSCNLDGSFRSEVRDSYFHSTRDPNPGGAGYGIGLTQYAADNLYENNVVWNFNKMTLARASGGGNVFGYNYMTDGYGQGYRSIVEMGAGPNHYAGAHMELFEGNESFNFDTESFWGNAIYGTVFRNHWTGMRRSSSPLVLIDANNRRAVGVQLGGWWFSFVGNVLGYPGMPLLSGKDTDGNDFAQRRFIFQSDIANLNVDADVPMWKLGYEGTNWPDHADPLVLARTLRHGNYDYVSNAIVWDPTLSRHDLPPSLYLTTKPAFFGANPWPWVTPEDSARPFATLPAKVRFDALHP